MIPILPFFNYHFFNYLVSLACPAMEIHNKYWRLVFKSHLELVFFHLIATFLIYISKSDKLTLNFDIYINQLMEHEDAYRYIKDTWICLSTIINHSSGSYRSSRKFTKHPNIMCTKNHPGRWRLIQKASFAILQFSKVFLKA